MDVMSNHIHMVLSSRPDLVDTWDDSEVARRWLMIFLKLKDRKGNALEPNESEIETIHSNPVALKTKRSWPARPSRLRWS